MEQGNRGQNTSDLADVFLAAIDKSLDKTHVSDVCEVISVNGRWAKVKLINKPTINTDAFISNQFTINVGDYVLVVYTDLDTRANLEKIINGKKIDEVDDKTVKHSINNAIIIMKLDFGGEE